MLSIQALYLHRDIALLDRLKAESKGGTKKGGKPKEEPDGSGTGEPDSGDGEK